MIQKIKAKLRLVFRKKICLNLMNFNIFTNRNPFEFRSVFTFEELNCVVS